MAGRKKLEEEQRRAVLSLTVSKHFRDRLSSCAKKMGLPLSRAVESLVLETPREFAKISRDSIEPLVSAWLQVAYYNHMSKVGADSHCQIRVEIAPNGNVGLVMRTLDGTLVNNIEFHHLLNIDDEMPSFLNNILNKYLSAAEVDSKLND